MAAAVPCDLCDTMKKITLSPMTFADMIAVTGLGANQIEADRVSQQERWAG